MKAVGELDHQDLWQTFLVGCFGFNDTSYPLIIYRKRMEGSVISDGNVICVF